MAELAGSFIVVLCYMCYLWTAKKFCKAYLESSRMQEWVFVLVLFAGWILQNIMSKYCGVPNIVYDLSGHFFLLGAVALFFRGTMEKKVLVSSMLITVTILVENFCASCYSCLYLIWLHTQKDIPVPFLNEWEMNLILCISLLTGSLAVYLLSIHPASFFSGKTKRCIVLAVPFFMTIAVFDVANWGAGYGILVRSGGNLGLYYDQIFSNAGFGIFALLFMLAIGFYVLGMDKIYLEQRKSSQYFAQVAAYQILEEQYSQLERLRHDMKNHIIALGGLLENKEWEKMRSYLKNMEEGAGIRTGEEVTGNQVVDALLEQKRKAAEEKNILWECDVQVPKSRCISEFDLCVLFGNILDNALEACERLPYSEATDRKRGFIKIQAKVVKHCFLLEVQNSAEEPYVHGAADRKNSKIHGVGLLNVNDVVNRYNGVVNINFQNAVFTISILIPINAAVHDSKQAV